MRTCLHGVDGSGVRPVGSDWPHDKCRVNGDNLKAILFSQGPCSLLCLSLSSSPQVAQGQPSHCILICVSMSQHAQLDMSTSHCKGICSVVRISSYLTVLVRSVRDSVLIVPVFVCVDLPLQRPLLHFHDGCSTSKAHRASVLLVQTQYTST